jgi:hypothetical protein
MDAHYAPLHDTVSLISDLSEVLSRALRIRINRAISLSLLGPVYEACLDFLTLYCTPGLWCKFVRQIHRKYVTHYFTNCQGKIAVYILFLMDFHKNSVNRGHLQMICAQTVFHHRPDTYYGRIAVRGSRVFNTVSIPSNLWQQCIHSMYRAYANLAAFLDTYLKK